MITSRVAVTYELEQVRMVFEDIGTQAPERIWESLLRLARDFTGASAVRGFTAEGEPGEWIAENPAPTERGLLAAVTCVLISGHRARIGNVFVLPILYRADVLGAVALEVPAGWIAGDRGWRLECVFSYAGMFFSTCPSAA